MPDTVYLDYNASTPCDPRVVDEMIPLLADGFANPASRSHRMGQRAFTLLEDARRRLAVAIGGRYPSEITFTSGATEANNLALKGVSEALADRGRHIVTQVTEHPSVLEPLRHLEGSGWKLTILGVEPDGRIRPDELLSALRPDTVLVSLMLANNETGTIQPIREANEILRDHPALLHCDAAQGPGKLGIDVGRLGADLVTFSGHKFYGPKGIGALFMRRRRPPIRPHPLLHGGGQENGIRSGTPNVPAAVGMARAMEIASAEWAADAARTAALRETLEQRILNTVEGATVNGPLEDRLPGTSNMSFAGVDGNALLASLTDLAVSSGSACSSARPEPSRVLRAMGVVPDLAAASIRFSLGRPTTEEEVIRAADRVVEEVTRLRAMRRSR